MCFSNLNKLYTKKGEDSPLVMKILTTKIMKSLFYLEEALQPLDVFP